MIISDLHVHFHQRYNTELFFNSIKNNFQKFYKSEDSNHAYHVICLTESAGVNFFNKLYLKSESVKNWSFIHTNNKNAIIAKHQSGFRFFIFSGRQIVTKENLEVLAIGMSNEFPDGNSIDHVLKEVISNGSIPIIPWGFGKWTGSRGNVVAKIIEQNLYHPLFLGDNGNRPNFIKLPSIFQQAKEKKIFNLQGSDPLPFRNEEKKPSSFGVFIDAELDPNLPFDSFSKIISSADFSLKTYGHAESYLKFFKHQIGMQIVKRLRKK